jgi:hypothetical protein
MFSELVLKAASESALQAIYPELVKLQDFAHNYRELEDRPGASIVVPVYDLSAAADFVAGTNQYDSGVNEVNGATLTLDKHLVKSVAITDRDLAETGIQWAKDAGIAVAKTLGRALNSYVFGMMNGTNLPLSASINLGTKAGIANLYKVAADNGLDVGDSIVVLNPTEFAKVLAQFDYMAYGGPEAVRFGYIPGAFGFVSMVCSTNLPEGVDGVIINRNTVGIASRYLAPMAGAYPNAWKAVDPDSSFTIGFREFTDLGSGMRYIAGEALVGAKIFFDGAKAVRLITNA